MSYKILTQKNTFSSFSENFALDVLEGLSKNPKELYSKYLYDDTGSKIFQKITDLEEYYLTQCEFEIFRQQQQKISSILAQESFRLIELGAGDGRKTKILIEGFLQNNLDFEYIPIDISEGAMKTLVDSMQQEFSDASLQINGLVAEYFDAISWLTNTSKKRNVIIFLGSNIGNFAPPQAKKFLRHIWNLLNNGDYLLIGFDLKKDLRVLEFAYSDSHGVTKDFNLNLLERINCELGGNFDIDMFRHFAQYNIPYGAMESWLISTKDQDVYIENLGKIFNFHAWEGINLECSYKYTVSQIEEYCKDTGYEIVTHLTDQRKYYIDSIWKAKKKLPSA